MTITVHVHYGGKCRGDLPLTLEQLWVLAAVNGVWGIVLWTKP